MQELVAEFMAAWRRAERLTATLPLGSPEHEAAKRACDRPGMAFQELTFSGVAHAISIAEARMLVADAGKDLEPDSER